MPLGLTWLDVLLIVALAMLLVQGHRRGLWVVLGNLVGLVGGAAIAFYALPEVAKFVTAPQWRWAALIATLVLLVAAGQYVGAAIGEAIRLRVNLPALRLVDRLLGALAAGLAGALVLWLVAFSIAASGSTAVTREVNRSQVITALDTVMPDSLLAWAARSRSAVADLDAARAGLATSPLWEELSGLIADAPALTIAALNGTAAGGALGMVLACDLRIAVPSATIFYPVMRLGYLPPPSDVVRMVRLVGRSRAAMILSAGQRIGAEEALAWGLIDRIVPREALMDTALALCAGVIAAKPGHAEAIGRMVRVAARG